MSGPARRTAPAPRTAASSRRDHGIAVGLITALEGLAQHRLLDRLIRGRIWIGLIAFALIGIVTLQLGLLQLNGDIGRALEREALVQRENAVLSIENSELAASDAIESRAGHLGMQFAPLSALRFLAARPGGDARAAAATLSTPIHSTVTAAGETAAGETPAGATTTGSPAASSESPAAGESPTSPQAGASPAQTSSPPAGESAPTTAAPGQQAPSGASTPASATGAPGTGAPAPGGSTEATPAGGTQATAAGG